MLDVHRADDVDSHVDQLEDVLVTLFVAAARYVRVRDLVDERNAGLAPENRVDVHLLHLDAAVSDLAPWHDLEPLDEHGGLLSPVRLDVTDHHVDASLLEGVCLFEHSVRLANAGREAEVELESPTLGSLDELEKVLRSRSRCRHEAMDYAIPGVPMGGWGWAREPRWRVCSSLRAGAWAPREAGRTADRERC